MIFDMTKFFFFHFFPRTLSGLKKLSKKGQPIPIYRELRAISGGNNYHRSAWHIRNEYLLTHDFVFRVLRWP